MRWYVVVTSELLMAKLAFKISTKFVLPALTPPHSTTLQRLAVVHAVRCERLTRAETGTSRELRRCVEGLPIEALVVNSFCKVKPVLLRGREIGI